MVQMLGHDSLYFTYGVLANEMTKELNTMGKTFLNTTD